MDAVGADGIDVEASNRELLPTMSQANEPLTARYSHDRASGIFGRKPPRRETVYSKDSSRADASRHTSHNKSNSMA